MALVLLVGLAMLYWIDSVLRREYRTEASTQAIQTEALLDAFVHNRTALLAGVRALFATSEWNAGAARRFQALARDILAGAPDIAAIYLLDTAGVVLSAHVRDTGAYPVVRRHSDIPLRAEALARAAETRRPALSQTLQVRDGKSGMVLYLPVLRDTVLVGFVGGALNYQALFADALGGQLQGRFAYRVSDQNGTTIGISPDYPRNPADLNIRPVPLIGGQSWELAIAIPRFQPFLPRLVNWSVGLLVLSMLAFLFIRENARSVKWARHSQDLENLSANLVDANLRLEERAQQIADAHRAKSRFLANVSHELRTPLNAIVGYNSLALEEVYGPLPDYLRSAHQRIRTAAEHLLALVTDVLDLAKIESGRTDLDLQQVDVGAVMEGVVTVIAPIAEAKDVRFNSQVVPDLPPIVTDPRHLKQILLNLASNAVKFTERGSVSVMVRKVWRDGREMLSVVVRDTGVGIREEDVERIFDEFEQVHQTARGESIQRGSGLGLTISRKLARALGGDITVQSRPNRGSTFELQLPVRSGAADAHRRGERTVELLSHRMSSPGARMDGARLGTSGLDAPGSSG